MTRFEYFKSQVRRFGLLNAIKLNILRKLYKDADPWLRVTVSGHDVLVRPDSPDIEVATESLGPELEPLKDVLAIDFTGLIIDAGGYIGTAAIKLSEMYPNATVISIEPSSENFDILVRNIERQKNIRAIKAALVSKSTGNVQLSNRGTGQWGFTIVDSPLDNPGAAFIEEVQTVCLEDLKGKFENRDIGLIKLDIEGSEKDLFDSAGEPLASVHAVFVELHDHIVAGCTDAFMQYSINRTYTNFGGEKWLSLKK